MSSRTANSRSRHGAESGDKEHSRTPRHPHGRRVRESGQTPGQSTAPMDGVTEIWLTIWPQAREQSHRISRARSVPPESGVRARQGEGEANSMPRDLTDGPRDHEAHDRISCFAMMKAVPSIAAAQERAIFASQVTVSRRTLCMIGKIRCPRRQEKLMVNGCHGHLSVRDTGRWSNAIPARAQWRDR
jgi:hypothetical protein